jgi:hypothetical protein
LRRQPASARQLWGLFMKTKSRVAFALAGVLLLGLAEPIFAASGDEEREEAAPNAGDVPCEQLIKQLDDALKASKVSDVEMTKAIVLRHRGSKECKAQKYSAADRHLGEALKIVGK